MKQQIIMKLLTGAAGLGIALGAVGAHATPETDRQELIKYYTNKYPNINIEDYVYGALAFDADSKAQYDAIMEFPPFDSQVEAGRKMWETPFKNGKTYAENGAVVPVEVSSGIAGTSSIAILAEKNAQPLVGSFNLSGGTLGFISTRIKMGSTSLVRAVVKAGGKSYTAAKEVKVTIGGCGG